MTNTTTKTGVATLKKLQKECLTIDLTKVRFCNGFTSWRDDFDPNAPPTHHEVNTDGNGENPHIKLGRGPTKRGFGPQDFVRHPSGKWKRDGFINYETGNITYHNLVVYKFQGGKRGRFGFAHNDFTNAQILVDKSTDEILGVGYVPDNDYLNEWLRQTIDPNIPNNYYELHAEKEFEVLITTTTYSTEKVKVVGRSYDECVETMKQNDPMLDVASKTWVSGCGVPNSFSGMKTTMREGDKPKPSSYEEWVSLQDREVA